MANSSIARTQDPDDLILRFSKGGSKPPRFYNQSELILLRMAEHSRLICGMCLPFPLEVLEITDDIAPELFRDERARAFLLTLRANRAELEAAADPSAVAIQLAKDSPHFRDIFIMTTTANLAVHFDQLPDLVRELRRDALALNQVSSLAGLLRPDGRPDGFNSRIQAEIRQRWEAQYV